MLATLPLCLCAQNQLCVRVRCKISPASSDARREDSNQALPTQARPQRLRDRFDDWRSANRDPALRSIRPRYVAEARVVVESRARYMLSA